jgi:LuxR family maltose regulon positive regulatory protein
MAVPLLTTKLYIPPPRLDLVPRPRLIRRLDQAVSLRRRLVLVSAPAGFGKTTLLIEWINRLRSPASDLELTPAGRSTSQAVNRRSQIQVAWLSLDEEDNDAARFWTYVIAALQRVHAELGKEVESLLQSSQPPSTQAILTPLINGAAALPNGLVLFLDDYHVIHNRAIHDGITFLLDHQPRQLQLVLSTRADPPLPVSRLRVRGQLTELRVSDLRFTPDEAAAFLGEMMGLDLEPEDIAALQARTEGWIAGLQLAALSMQGWKDAHAFVTAFTGSHHYVLEYLTEEVVRRQPEPVQQFLEQTAILERLCGPLCGAVTGASNGSDMLDHLRQGNLFIVPLDDEHHWYRYHHLFADLMGNLLRKNWPIEHVYELHRRASEWHERFGSLDDAVRHALQAKDYDQAASLIERAARTTMLHGRLTTLLDWLRSLPEALLRARPRLRVYQAWALSLGGQVDVAERMLQDARNALQALPPSPDNVALRGELAALLASIATLHEKPATIIEEAQEALTYLPEEDLVSRARATLALGLGRAYDDDMERAIQAWHEAHELALEAGNWFLAAAIIELPASIQIYQQGHLQEAADMLQRIIDLGTRQDGSCLPFAGTAHALLAEVFLERDDLDAAVGYLETGVELIRQGGIGYSLAPVYCTKARLRRAFGDAEGVLEALQAAEKSIDARCLWHLIIHQAACQVRLRLWLGDVEAASRWAEGELSLLKREIPEDLPVFLREVQQIALARVSLARGKAEEALEMLDRLHPQAEAAGRMARVMEICLLKALSLQSQGDTAAALKPLERALSLAEPEGHVRVFLEEGAPMGALLRQAASRGICPKYVNKLVSVFGSEEEEGSPVSPSPQTRVLLEPLTKRECEILLLICEGCSNQEIAERLVVTLNTVKKHTSNIYGKLDVRSRTQAVARAQELGIL